MSSEAPSFRDLQRQLTALIPDVPALGDAATSPGLEITTTQSSESPRLVSADLLEHPTLQTHAVRGVPVPGIAAFLDGTQQSRVLQYAGAIPIVRGTVGAVIRVRRLGRLTTWALSTRMRLYAPLRLLERRWTVALSRLGLDVVDLDAGADESSVHPFAIRDLAVHMVQRHREEAEHELARLWCASPDGILYVDGGLAGDDKAAKSSHAIGVVKSHRTLYVTPVDLPRVMALREGERTSVFRITSPKRTPVASWYLRTRDPLGRDPLWGLVRVEASAAVAGPEITAQADLMSSWILAERAPVSAPDARWDTMAYGIRDCEEFLRAAAVA